MRPDGDNKVRQWLDQQVAETLYLSVVSLSELMAGVAILPAGERKDNLKETLSLLIDRLFGPRVLAFDEPSAIAYANWWRPLAVVAGRS